MLPEVECFGPYKGFLLKLVDQDLWMELDSRRTYFNARKNASKSGKNQWVLNLSRAFDISTYFLFAGWMGCSGRHALKKTCPGVPAR